MRAFLQEKPENPHGFHFVAPSRSSEKGPAPERPAFSGGAPGPHAAKLPGPSPRPRRARGTEGDPAATSRDLSAGGGPAVPRSGAGWLEGRQALETRAAGSQPCPLPAQPPPGRAAPPGPPRRRGSAAPLLRRGLCRFPPATGGPVPPRSSSASPGGEGGRDGGRRQSRRPPHQRRGRRAGPGRVGARWCPSDRRHRVRGHRARPCRGSRGWNRGPATWPGRGDTSGLKSPVGADVQTGVLLYEHAVNEGASVFPPTPGTSFLQRALH
ncbi:collagen alpha-1(I) chain-like [Vidua macroura]|uniref:collagen alpha-1(I) chain-like n=1 Tax=Vidua macroura TaxID=187451 RepID=UPI0023A8688A|nr:collagen alpha-1(I) chain-like [Vidua macroura]XP_053842026.1 collagen alpha-1(I) chain-like [Vidua macroura]XP_053842027.1 collagen alpha-1(I) chain-like [Vidua macroura]XP_053842028.1 collagen alpha-1(I) chain-like [Vidua macroura]